MTDTEIAQKAKLKPIAQIAASLGIKGRDLELYGDFKAKISLEALKGAGKTKSKYVVITGITPTHLGEGKTTIQRTVKTTACPGVTSPGSPLR